MDTLKHCVIAICTATLVIALAGMYCIITSHSNNQLELLCSIGIIMAGMVIAYLICTRSTYILIRKLEKDKEDRSNKELERKKDWETFELEQKVKEMQSKKDWKNFELQLLNKEKEAELQRTLNEKKAVLDRMQEAKKVGLSVPGYDPYQ